MAESVLKYQTLQSSIHISFWQELSKRKLEIFRLSTEPVSLIGKVQIANDPRLPSTVEISSESFSKVTATKEGGGGGGGEGRETTHFENSSLCIRVRDSWEAIHCQYSGRLQNER